MTLAKLVKLFIVAGATFSVAPSPALAQGSQQPVCIGAPVAQRAEVFQAAQDHAADATNVAMFIEVGSSSPRTSALIEQRLTEALAASNVPAKGFIVCDDSLQGARIGFLVGDRMYEGYNLGNAQTGLNWVIEAHGLFQRIAENNREIADRDRAITGGNAELERIERRLEEIDAQLLEIENRAQ